MPNACKVIATGRWSIFASGRASKAKLLRLVAVLFILLAANVTWAQPFAPNPTTTTPDWGDPYQFAASGAQGSVSSSVVPAAVGLLGGGRVSNGQLVANLDPYATPPTATQLNAPIVEAPSALPAPIVASPLFQGGPVYNSLHNWQPLFPQLHDGIDSRLYVRGEYLLWDVSGMETPPIVTSSPDGTPQNIAAVLGQPGTTVLFGGSDVNDGTASGFLVSGGLWISSSRNIAVESEYFRLGDLDDGYSGSSDGTVILGRPYFDAVNGNQTARLVSYPGQFSGDLRVATESKLRSFLLNGRISLCPTHGACCQRCGMRDRTDWIIGYRNIRLRDSFTVNETSSNLGTNLPGSRAAADQFQTKNEFNGLQLGVVHRTLLNRAWLESSLRVAIGNNEQTQSVNGNTTYSGQGASQSFTGGLLTQRTNIGTRSRDDFMMVPELGLRLGMRLTNRLHANIGYSVLYLPNVIRASEQIDTDINPGLIPPESDPLIGGPRPRALWIQSDYLAHGLHFGGELHF